MDLKLLQREVAEQIGCSKAALLMWENGRSSPAIRFWPAIIEFLGYDPVEEPRTFAELLKIARWRLGCSHRRLAKLLGLDPSAIYKWEHGKIPRNVRSWERLEPMFEALGIGLEIRRRLWPKRYRESVRKGDIDQRRRPCAPLGSDDCSIREPWDQLRLDG